MTALVTDSGRKTPARHAGSAILALQSDDRLVKLFRSGHERAFDAIVQRYRGSLVRFSGGILPESRTEDAVQQAFINAHAALLASDEPLQLKAWLYAITRNAALNMLRQNGWNYEEIPLDFDGVRRPDQVFDQRIELQQTVAAMNKLPDRQRDALVMRELEGRSYDEIALALGTGDGAVRQLLNRARVTLRSAASMLVPPPIVLRAAASLPPSDGRRMAEILGGLGAAGIAKAGATALVAGTLVVGAVEAPLPIGNSHKTTRERATLSADKGAQASVAKRTTPVVQPPSHSTAAVQRSAPAARHRGSSGSDTQRSGSDDTRVSGDDHRSGDGSLQRSGSNSGTDDSRTRTQSGSGSGDSLNSGSGSSGRGGSDDQVATVTTPTSTTTTDNSGPGSVSSGSGTSGSGTSGSGETTSGSSGSGSSSGSSGSGSSGSDDGLVSSTTAPVDH